MFRVLAHGHWREGRVRTRSVPSSRQSDSRLDSSIDTAWQAAQRASGVRLFDGPVCRLERSTVIGETLELDLSQTSYRIFVGTNLSGRASEIPAESRANPMGVSVGVISEDNFLLLGVRSDAVAYYSRKLHPFAGTIDPQDRDNVFDTARRELREELNLEPASLESIVCVGLVEDAMLLQPELIFVARAGLPAERIARQVDPVEHSRIWSIPADAASIDHALNASRGEFTPVALATLLFVGRMLGGSPRFESHAGTITLPPPPS